MMNSPSNKFLPKHTTHISPCLSVNPHVNTTQMTGDPLTHTWAHTHFSLSHGGGLAGSVVSQEGHHLVLVEVEAQLVEGQLIAHLVDLGQLVYTNHQRQVAGLLFNTTHLLWREREPASERKREREREGERERERG